MTADGGKLFQKTSTPQGMQIIPNFQRYQPSKTSSLFITQI